MSYNVIQCSARTAVRLGGPAAPDAADCALDAGAGGAAPPDGRQADLGGPLPGRHGPGVRSRYAAVPGGGRHTGKFLPHPAARTAALRHVACGPVLNLLNQRAAPRVPVRS